jgi:gliding motility-associated lipoprotein GldH
MTKPGPSANIQLASVLLALCTGLFFACTPIDLYEKTASIPGHKWQSSFKPSFTFHITDTAAAYQLFLTLRHTDRYNYKNIYVNIRAQLPGMDSFLTVRKDLPLATDDKGWLGSGMDDIYEHRIPLTAATVFRKPGDYTYVVEQIMREDPLEHVLNVGIRLEKKQ